jgi:ABC-2 type transport system permease protein
VRPLGVLLRKELHATFTSPVAWVVGGVFLLVAGYTFSLSLFMSKVANLTYVFHQIYVLLVLLVPVLTMRSFAEERKAETLELLLAAPVGEHWIVLAKFLASLALVALLLLASTSYAVVLALHGEPDLAPIAGGYLALLLLAGLLVAAGTF